MNTVEKDALAVANQLDPSAPVVEAANAALATAVDPSVGNIVSDIELVFSLVKEIKAKLAGVHPTVLAVFKAMI